MDPETWRDALRGMSPTTNQRAGRQNIHEGARRHLQGSVGDAPLERGDVGEVLRTASFATYYLTHWGRDRQAGRVPVD